MTHAFKRLTNVSLESNCDDPIYSLEEIKDKFPIVEEMPGNCWLCVDDSKLFVDFALVEMHSQTSEGTKVVLVFHGTGPCGSLREPRHIWWGPQEKGYTFFLPAEAVIKSLERLKDWFDFD